MKLITIALLIVAAFLMIDGRIDGSGKWNGPRFS